jgi:hypothetical protein
MLRRVVGKVPQPLHRLAQLGVKIWRWRALILVGGRMRWMGQLRRQRLQARATTGVEADTNYLLAGWVIFAIQPASLLP